jgi:Domain of unknown function (DUF4388)
LSEDDTSLEVALEEVEPGPWNRGPRPETHRTDADRLLPETPVRGLAGDLQTMLLADVLLWAATRRKSGTLHVRQGATRKRVVFQDGVLHSSSSNDPRETLGQFLVRDALISEEQLFRTLLKQEAQGSLLGVMLVSEGLITAEQLKRTLREKAEAIVYDLFLWSSGNFVFQEGRLPKTVPINLELETAAVVREGVRRRRRYERIRERIPSGEVTFKAVEGAAAPTDPVELGLFGLAASGKTLLQIALETRRSEFEVAERLFALCELSVLSVLTASGEPTAADTVGAIQELLRLAQKAVLERRFDDAFESYQDVLAFDHLNQEAKKGLIAVSDGRKRDRLARRVPPDKVPVVRTGALGLSREKFSAEEGFVLSRINGRWDVQSILKLCPLGEDEALTIFTRLLDRKVIELK